MKKKRNISPSEKGVLKALKWSRNTIIKVSRMNPMSSGLVIRDELKLVSKCLDSIIHFLK